jgi:uncharacterized protein (TIGR00645 family)
MPQRKPSLERWLEQGLFASRWLMAPFYAGLAVALAALLVVFFQELVGEISHLFGDGAKPETAILMALSLIDLSLAGNLILIVVFSGYENFVSRISVGEHEDRPDWMGTVDFSGLKMKLIASIVAISAIALLKAFMNAAEPGVEIDPAGQTKLLWLVVVHLTFVISGVLLATMDLIAGKSATH